MVNNKNKSTLADVLVLTMLLGLFFLILEFKHPYYFLSDDNRTFYLPYFIHNFRALIAGEFPLFNFHQYLGIPHFSNFQSAVFNPLVYFSVFLSNTIFGHSFFAIDITVIINFIIGSIGFYYLVRNFTSNRLSSLFGAFIWPLSSFNIFISNSWWIFSGVTAFFPWMVFFSLKLYKNSRFKTLFFLIITRLFLFYIGHIEYFIYSMIFEFLTITLLILTYKDRKNYMPFIKKYSISYLITFIYALPILIPAWLQTKTSALKHSKGGFGALFSNRFTITSWLKGLFNPFITRNNFYQRSQFGFIDRALPYLSHIGYVAIILILIYLVLNFNKMKRSAYTHYVFFMLFMISLFWACGFLSGAVLYVPILNRFRWPFKIYAYSNFYLILASSYAFYFILNKLKQKMKNIFPIIFGIILIALTLLNFYFIYSNVYISLNNKKHKDDIPLVEPLSEYVKEGRIFSLGISDTDPFSVSTLGFNYATMLDLKHFAGYDPLVPLKNYKTALSIFYRASYKIPTIPFSYLRRWGVKWYVLNKDKEPNDLYHHYFNTLLKNEGLYIFVDEEKRTVFKDTLSNPMIYWKKTEISENINIEMHTNSIHIHTDNSIDKLLVVNYLFNNYFRATINKNSTLPIIENNIGQMEILVPKGHNQIIIQYSDPYLNFSIFIVVLFSLSIFAYFMIKKYYRN
ncbi:MAG: hypothetical protein U9P73_04375 [Candidatus Cloacimonadota bacterium]|nr:hypothetical protein [Candidatus Cloacimonadota bacterium]